MSASGFRFQVETLFSSRSAFHGWSVCELLGKARRIGRGREGLLGQERRGGVVAVVRRLRGEARDDHVGPEAADGEHDVGQHLVVAPDAQRLVGALRVAEVARAREELLGAVDAARREQLLRADEPEQLVLLGPDEVLPAVAARHREVARAKATPSGQPGEEARVLVVGVGGHVEHAAGHTEAPDARRELSCMGLPGRLRERRRPDSEAHDQCRSEDEQVPHSRGP